MHTELVCPPAASPLSYINEPLVGSGSEMNSTKKELLKLYFVSKFVSGCRLDLIWGYLFFWPGFVSVHVCYSVVNTGSPFVCSLYRNICSWQFVLWLWASCLAPCVALVWTPASRNSQSGSAHKFTAQQVYTLDAAIELYHWCLYEVLCAALDLRQNYFVDQSSLVQSGGSLKWPENESSRPSPAFTSKHTVLPALTVNHLVILASPKNNFWNKLIIFSHNHPSSCGTEPNKVLTTFGDEICSWRAATTSGPQGVELTGRKLPLAFSDAGKPQ